MIEVNGVDIPDVCVLSDYIFALPVEEREDAWASAWRMYMDIAELVERGSWIHTSLFNEAYAAMGCLWTTRDFTKPY